MLNSIPADPFLAPLRCSKHTSQNSGSPTKGGSKTADTEISRSSPLEGCIGLAVPFIIPEHADMFSRLWPYPDSRVMLLSNVLCSENGRNVPLFEFLLRKLNSIFDELQTHSSNYINRRSMTAKNNKVPSNLYQTLIQKPPHKALCVREPSNSRPGDRHEATLCRQQKSLDVHTEAIMSRYDSPEIDLTSFSDPGALVSANTSVSLSEPDTLPKDDGIVFFDKIPDITAYKHPWSNKPNKGVPKESQNHPHVLPPLAFELLKDPPKYINSFGFKSKNPCNSVPLRHDLPIRVCSSLEEVAEHMLNRRNALSEYDNEEDDCESHRREKIESQPLDVVVYHVEVSGANFINNDGVEVPCTILYHFKEKLAQFIALIRKFYDMKAVKISHHTYGIATCTSYAKYSRMHQKGYQPPKCNTFRNQTLPVDCKGALSFQYSADEKKLAIKAIHKHHKLKLDLDSNPGYIRNAARLDA